ncbi:hypothetical protein FOCC_FOCC013961 [Frankliniella occidentalis]|nr:hypothetical protein FOCC_FOCC013961 [Frankliniella occidentalis]
MSSKGTGQDMESLNRDNTDRLFSQVVEDASQESKIIDLTLDKDSDADYTTAVGESSESKVNPIKTESSFSLFEDDDDDVEQLLSQSLAAYTGVTANLLKGGLTSHRAFGLPFEDEGLGLTRSQQAQNLEEADVIIWDEISMVQAWHLHVLDRFLRDVMRKEEPFGSKIIILGGDFHQILPVVPGGSRADIVDAAVTSSNLWPLFEKYTLTKNQRALEDQEYADWLLKSANFVNELVLERLMRGKEGDRVYYSTTTLDKSRELQDARDQHRLHYPADYLDKLESASLPPHKLHLIPEANVMLIRNLRVGGGLCNGTRLKVLKLHPNLIVCRIMTGSRKGETVGIFRITITTNELSLPGKLRRRQFPLKPCYAMTVNKSQGQTLIREGLYLRTPLWSHGQLCVALSRVRCRQAVKIMGKEGQEQGRINANRGAAMAGNNIYTLNHIYAEVLQAVNQNTYLPAEQQGNNMAADVQPMYIDQEDE